MKKIIFFLLLACSYFSNAQIAVYKKIAQRHDDYANNNWRGQDSILFAYNTDAVLTNLTALKGDSNNGWNNYYKYSYVLNALDKVLVQTRENWNGTSWVNNTRYTYTYDVNGDNSLIEYHTWNGSTWNPAGQITYTGYNASHKFQDEIAYVNSAGNWVPLSKNHHEYVNNADKINVLEKYIWNSSTATWTKNERYYYNYNLDSISIATRSLPDSNQAWATVSRIMYNYSTTPFLLNETINQKWDTSLVTPIWVNTSRIVNTYTASNLILKNLTELYVNGAWNASARNTYTYNASDKLIEYYTELVNNGWQNNSRKTYAYTSNNITEELQYIGNGNSWDLDKKINYDYDVQDNNIYKEQNQFTGANYLPLTRDFYYYNMFVVGIPNVSVTKNSFVLYPNPSSNQIHIQYTAEKNKHIAVHIIDQIGKEKIFMTQPLFTGQNDISIPCETLAAGTYYVQITSLETGLSKTEKFQMLK